MRKNRRQHSAEFKSKVAIEAIKEHKTLSQIADLYELHANQIGDWKKTVVEQSSILFDKREKKETALDMEALQSPFLEQIGILQMEVAFLKKKLKQLGHP